MKRLALLCIVLVSASAIAQKPAVTKVDRHATCKGGTCRACKNCKYCKHCKKEGGTCSVCSKSATVVKKTGKRVARR